MPSPAAILPPLPFRKLLHQPVNLLSLTRQPEARQKQPDGVIKRQPLKVQLIHVRVHHLNVVLVVLA